MMLAFFILLIVLPIFTLRPRKDESKKVFDYTTSMCLKGILCLFVMFHNLGLDYFHDEGPMRLISESAGGVGVGIFFFLSAFGILRAYQAKGNKFLLKLIFINCTKLWLIAVGINLLTYLVYFNGAFETKDAVLRILNFDIFNHFNRMNRHGWFIATIILLYLLFALTYFICSKLKIDKKFIIAGIIMFLIPFGFKIASWITDAISGMYVREITMFSFGIFYATFYERVNYILKKGFWIALPISAVAMVIGFIFNEPLSTYGACIFLMTIAQRFTWENKVTYFLGKICIGVYLFLHFSTLTLQHFINNEALWLLLNAGFILLFAVLLYGVIVLIEKGIVLIRIKIIEKKLSMNEQQKTVH